MLIPASFHEFVAGLGLASLGRKRRRAHSPAHRARTRAWLRLEEMEDRCLLTTITEFPTPTASSDPRGITAGPDGNLWFTELNSDKIGTINPATHAITEFQAPTGPDAEPQGITAGPDGNLWFTEYVGNIGMINPTTHAITEFPVPTANADPIGITAGPDGNLWFTELAGNQIGMINPTTHAITEFPVPTANSLPEGITTGPDGNLWFTESVGGNQIGMINPTTHAITEFPVPTAGADPRMHHGGPRRQPLVHRVRCQPDRDDQPDDPRHHRVPRPYRQCRLPMGSQRAPTATSGSPST